MRRHSRPPGSCSSAKPDTSPPLVLTRYAPKKKIRKEVNLLAKKNETAAADDEKPLTKEELEEERRSTPVVSYWHQNLTLAIVPDRNEIKLEGTHPETAQYIHLEPSGQTSWDGKRFYYPIVFANECVPRSRSP